MSDLIGGPERLTEGLKRFEAILTPEAGEEKRDELRRRLSDMTFFKHLERLGECAKNDVNIVAGNTELSVVRYYYRKFENRDNPVNTVALSVVPDNTSLMAHDSPGMVWGGSAEVVGSTGDILTALREGGNKAARILVAERLDLSDKSTWNTFNFARGAYFMVEAEGISIEDMYDAPDSFSKVGDLGWILAGRFGNGVLRAEEHAEKERGNEDFLDHLIGARALIGTHIDQLFAEAAGQPLTA